MADNDRRDGAVISFNLDYKALLMMAEKAPDLAKKKMDVTMAKACREVVRLARAKHKFRTITGETDRAIRYTHDKESGEGIVYLDEQMAAHIRFLHEGSGLYGPHQKAFTIFPKNKKMLRFAISSGTAAWRPAPFGRFQEGGFTYAFGVTNPGIKKDQFLYESADEAEVKIQEFFDSAMGDLAGQLEQLIGGA